MTEAGYERFARYLRRLNIIGLPETRRKENILLDERKAKEQLEEVASADGITAEEVTIKAQNLYFLLRNYKTKGFEMAAIRVRESDNRPECIYVDLE